MLLLNACGHCLAGNAFWTAGLLEALSSELWALSSGLWVLSSELWTLESSELCIVFMSSELWALSSGELLLLLYSTWQSKSGVFQHCLRTFLVCLSTFSVRVYTAFQHCLRAFQPLSSILCMHFCRNLSISNSVFWAVRKVLELSRNACTQCWNAAGMRTGTPCAHLYCIPALLACIPTTFQYFITHFLLHFIAFLFHSYYISIAFLLHFHYISIAFLMHYISIAFLFQHFLRVLTLFLALFLH